MSLSVLPLSYCCNVHPSATVAELLTTLTEKTAHVQQLTGQPIAAGLWLADAVTRELTAEPALLKQLQDKLREHQLVCYTLNAFPYGNFHTERVKEQVYLPDWTQTDRLDYTLRCAHLLAALLPEGVEGSISTVPLGFKELCTAPDFLERCADHLLELARQLDQLHDDTGRVIRLAIEPEPLCVLETTAETLQFFELLRTRAKAADLEDAVQTHLGVCYDICHQAVEFEDIATSIQELQQADIRINKVHITCAIELLNPAENEAGREFLAQFAEPRYLHQTFSRQGTELVHLADLTADFARNPPPEWLNASSWRIHFHVPVHVEFLGPLNTTHQELQRGLQAIKQLEYAPHLEVETYTWNVLPDESQPEIREGMAKELCCTLDLLTELKTS